MAFTCKTCIDKEYPPDHWDLHAFKSYGSCEDCRKVATCVDCQCYKHKVRLK